MDLKTVEIAKLWHRACFKVCVCREAKIERGEINIMSIQKKSLISTLKTAKKANVASQASEEINSKPSTVASKRHLASKREML